MALPSSLQFESEQDFTENFVIPLLTRLGYALVLNYHGATEFGKDLIVGEFDRFIHVRYHAIQVKYVPSIGLSDSHDLVRDCEQAFKNPFHHPHTGQYHLISTFYVINGGSISEKATTHFFSSVKSQYGDNTRLVDGKALLQLDRSATVIGVEPVRAVLTGLLLEIRYNTSTVHRVCSSLRKMLEEDSPYPMQRVSSEATGSYLHRPHAFLLDHLGLLEEYWQNTTMFNRIVDSIDTQLSAADYRKTRAEAAYPVGDRIEQVGATLLAAIARQIAQLGPLVTP